MAILAWGNQKSSRKHSRKFKFLSYLGVAAIILIVVFTGTIVIQFFGQLDFGDDLNQNYNEGIFPQSHCQFGRLYCWHPPDDWITTFRIDGDIAFVLTYHGFLYLLDISDDNSLGTISKIYVGVGTQDMFITRDYLFTACGHDGYKIINIQSKTNPKIIIESAPEIGSVEKIYAHYNLLILGKGKVGIDLLDITNITDPQNIVSHSLSKIVHDIHCIGPYIYLALQATGAEKLNSDEFHFASIFENNDEESLYGNGFALLDVSNFNQPELVCYDFERNFDSKTYLKLHSHENILYLTDGKSGIKIFDLSSKYAPKKLSVYADEEYYIDVFKQGDLLYVSTYEQGLQIFNATDLSKPVKIAQYFTRYVTKDIFIDASRAFISNYKDGLISVDLDNDNDKLWDLDELILFNTDPFNQDSDFDKLTDFEELAVYKTDPTSEDTDQDGFNDFTEIRHNYDPLDPNDHPMYASLYVLLSLLGILIIIILSIRFVVVAERVQEKRKKISYKKLGVQKHLEIRLFKLVHLIRENEQYRFRFLARMLSVRLRSVQRIFELWQEKKCIDRLGDFDLTEQVFDKKSSKLDYSKNRFCYYCNTRIRQDQRICKKCNNDIHICQDCHHPISYNEPIGICPLCMTHFHLEHILPIVKEEGYCPVCQYEINLKEVGTVIPYLHKKKKKKRKED